MRLIRPSTLIILVSSINAFQHPTFASRLSIASKATPTTSESILNDAKGHPNSNLASAIFEWEKIHAQTSTLKKQDFSTRDGLRLVDTLARDILTTVLTDSPTYSDLVQEGMVALLRAMSTYNTYRSFATEDEGFAVYAKKSVQSALLNFLAHSSRPISLPQSLQNTLAEANAAAARLRIKIGKEPSLIQVAREINTPPEKLALYRKLHRTIVGRIETFVSMEDGLEIYDPTLEGSMSTPKFTEDEGSDDDEDMTEQDLYAVNLKEDNWDTRPPERTVIPMRDVTPDKEEINNPLLYTHHKRLKNELNQFLLETLTKEEREVIQLRFGLVDSQHGGKGWNASQISKRMGLTKAEVVEIASEALDRLRKAATATGDDPFVEVSL
eukprot:scaffold32961_cov70-Cyclotella_meneghiniana.AAC.10